MNSQEYINLFDNFVNLVDKQLEYFENEDTPVHSIVSSLPALISLVNTIGYLRGQDGMFLDIRPHTDKQAYFYEIEDKYEKRLETLITKVLESEEADNYKERLHSYFCKVRTLKPGGMI